LEQASGFNQQQVREERLKAQLIVRDTQWRALIERAESHGYFQGDVEFLLLFSGVMERSRIGACGWNDDEDRMLRESFILWYARACAIFPERGRGLRSFPEFLFERALLATGDYLLPSGR